MEKTVSVIVPVYNVEKYLHKCIKSILEQDYFMLEIILVDDGSTDKSGEICDIMANTDARIKVIHKKNGGLSDARNHGIDIATGEYLVFVDSDDYIHQSYVRILLQAVEHTDSDIAVCNFKEVVEGQDLENTDISLDNKDIKVYSGTEKNDRLFYDNLKTVVAWNKIYAKHLFTHLRYPVGRIHEDEYVIHHLLHMAKKIAYIDKVLYFYLQRNNSIMSTFSLKSVMDGYDALQERQKFWLETKQTQAYVQNLANQLFFATGRHKSVNTKYHDKALLKLLQKNIGNQIKNDDLKTLLGQYNYSLFVLFQKHPRLYYYLRENDNSKSLLKKILEKIIQIMYR